MHFINRNWDLTEDDDFKLNVEPKLTRITEAVAVYIDGLILVGWKLQTHGE